MIFRPVLAALWLISSSLCVTGHPLSLIAAWSGQEVYARNAASAARLEKALKAGAAQDFRTANRLLRELTASDPKDFEGWDLLGNLLFQQGKMGDAEKAFAQVLKLRAPTIPVLINLGQVQLAQKKNDAAVATLRRAVEMDPGNPRAQFFYGEAFLQSKRGTRAASHFYEALRLDPMGAADAHLRLASLFRAAGQNDKAADEYEKFLVKKPAYPDKEKLLKFIRKNQK